MRGDTVAGEFKVSAVGTYRVGAKAYKRAWYLANRERVTGKQRQPEYRERSNARKRQKYALADPAQQTHRAAGRRAIYQRDAVKILAQQKAHRDANREAINAHRRDRAAAARALKPPVDPVARPAKKRAARSPKPPPVDPVARLAKKRAAARQLYVADPERARARARDWRLANRERFLDRQRARYEKDPDYFREHRRRSYLKTGGREQAASWRALNRPRLQSEDRQRIAELDDRYVKRIIYQTTGIKHSAIPAQLIDAKRASMKLRRLIKERNK